MESLEQSLGEHPLARELTSDQVRALADCARWIVLTPGTVILREHGDADSLFLITNGRVVLEYAIPGRGPTQVEELRAGDILGFSWLQGGGRWTLDARATERSEVVALDATQLRRLMDDDPRLGVAVSRHMLVQLYQRLVRVRLQRLDLYREQ